jgi:hypothetical protein
LSFWGFFCFLSDMEKGLRQEKRLVALLLTDRPFGCKAWLARARVTIGQPFIASRPEPRCLPQ